MQKISLKMLLGIWLSLAVSSCGTTPPDVPICIELDITSGFCVHTMSSKEFLVNEVDLLDGKTWWELKPYMLRLPIDSYVALKSFIIKICKKSKMCKGKDITNWERTIGIIDKAIVK